MEHREGFVETFGEPLEDTVKKTDLATGLSQYIVDCRDKVEDVGRETEARDRKEAGELTSDRLTSNNMRSDDGER